MSELRIEVVSWKFGLFGEDEKKQKTIAGKYAVKSGPVVVAESSFNEGYQCAKITIPTKVLAKLEEMDAEIRQAIIDNFAK